MRKITSFILALALTLSLLVTAGAAGGDVTLTVGASRNGNRVTYTVTMDASTNKVAALQFTLKPSGMALASDADYHTEDYQNIFVDRHGEDSFGACGFTSSSGVYLAYGGNPAEESKIRYLTGEKPIMTITYTIDAGAVAPTLTVSDFKACESGTQAMENPYNCIYPQNPIAVPPASPTGVTVSGTVTSFGNDTDKVTIHLIEQGKTEASHETVVQGKTASYSIPNVASGTYTMKVMKQNHVTREYTLTVGDTAVTQDAKIHLKGDVNMDGKVDVGDHHRLFEHIQKMATIVDDYQLLIADTNEDGKIDVGDHHRLFEHIQNIKSLFDA